ncbi:hypothetical protein GGR52DRAFT_592451 [Hypoxylon sp. FL1284]|nr:hypothetical protein GGR52DRAFT_592451 [Hypoxylon sp. FL1284]
MSWKIYALALALLLPLASPLKLNVTAIGARDGVSTIECWQMDTPFDTSSQPGTSGTAVSKLGGVSNLTYSIIPSGFDGGVHNRYTNLASVSRWVAFTSGLAYITIPGDADASALVPGGQFGLIFAADTKEVSREGHRTQYPGVTETIALQVPTAGGKGPQHSLLHTGSCTGNDVAGLREFAMEEGAKLSQVGRRNECRADSPLPFRLR